MVSALVLRHHPLHPEASVMRLTFPTCPSCGGIGPVPLPVPERLACPDPMHVIANWSSTGATVADIGEFDLLDMTLTLRLAAYHGGRIAITAFQSDGSRWGVLSVNLPDERFEPREFAVKTWSENATWFEAAIGSGLFVDTGRRIATGGHGAVAQVWRILTPEERRHRALAAAQAPYLRSAW